MGLWRSEKIKCPAQAKLGRGPLELILRGLGARLIVSYSFDPEGAEHVARRSSKVRGKAIAVGADISKAAGDAQLF